MLLHLNHDCKRKYSLVFLSINNAIDREYNKYIKGKKFVKSLFDAVIFCSAFTRYLMILVILFGPFQSRLLYLSHIEHVQYFMILQVIRLFCGSKASEFYQPAQYKFERTLE